MSDQKKFSIGDVVTRKSIVRYAVNESTNIFENVAPVVQIEEKASGFRYMVNCMTREADLIRAEDVKKYAIKYAMEKLEFVANHPEYEVVAK